MHHQSILVSIQQCINTIKWSSPKQKDKATILCKCIFNLYTIRGYQFTDYVSLSSNYFIAIFPSKRDFIIKTILIDNGILDCDNSYNKAKGIAKGYRFNKNCLGQSSAVSGISSFTFSNATNNLGISYLFPHSENQHLQASQRSLVSHVNHFTFSTTSDNSSISYLFPHSRALYLQAFYMTILGRLEFDNDVDKLISTLSDIQYKDLVLNDDITDQYVYITFNKEKYRYKKANAIKLALETGNDLIQYKDKFYIGQPVSFLETKSWHLRTTLCQSVFNIKHKLFYCGRNDTNNRLDYNLTGLKKGLFEKLKFDGEKLAELDIANAQFAIASHLNPTIDTNFIDHAHQGTLYDHIEKELALPEGSGKKLMFRVAFDKVKHDNEFEQVRKLFPKYMQWVDGYKKEHGYKMFSNLLQKKEAEIMIDGVLNLLIANKYEVFTIHDALRVKQSQVDEINTLVQEYFVSTGFKCLLRKKDKEAGADKTAL